MSKAGYINQFKLIAVNAFKEFTAKDPLRMAAATAFFATFSLPAILLILIKVIGLFYKTNDLKQSIFKQLAGIIGRESSLKTVKISDQFLGLAHNWFAAIGGFIFLLFVVTTLFGVIRSSVNELWSVGIERNAGTGFYLQLRLKSALVIGFAGIVLIAQLIASALQLLLKDYLHQTWGNYNTLLFRSVSFLLFIIIASAWFTVLFKYLANAHPDWRSSLTGGIFTGILFTIGKTVLGLLLTFDTLSEVFGKTSAFVLILLFVFYTSFIFYYGAAFTKTWCDVKKKKMILDKHAYMYEIKKVRS